MREEGHGPAAAGGRDPRAGDQVAGISLPDPAADWPRISEAERARRAGVLAAIAGRIAEDGPRVALESPERGRQFMPFSALRGYDEMLAETVRRVRGRDGADGGCPGSAPGGHL